MDIDDASARGWQTRRGRQGEQSAAEMRTLPCPTAYRRGAQMICAALGAAFLWPMLASPSAQAQDGLKGIDAWSYQLQGNLLELREVESAVAVIDGDHVRRHARLENLRKTPRGQRRLLLGYLSIGEAEAFRSYWPACCAATSPSWLTTQTQGWAENFAVRYWQEEWQQIVTTRLAEIIQAGFDGVYLDRADVWEVMSPERPTAREDMIQFVAKLAHRARQQKPGFAIVMQNAEELLSSPALFALLDAVAKEDLIELAPQFRTVR